MTLHQLQIFAAVTKHLNFTKTAQELRIGQSSVSQQLKLLEEECGVKLYKNLGRGVEITEEGATFLPEVKTILDQVQRLKTKFKMDEKKRMEQLKVGGSSNLSTAFLPMVLTLFKESHPHVELTLKTNASRLIERLLLSSEVEIAVITNPSGFRQLVYEPCRKEKLVAFTSAKNPLIRGGKMSLAELAQIPIVIKKGKAGETSRVEQALRRLEAKGVKLNIAMQCDSPHGVKEAVKAGVGLGVLHRDLVNPDIESGELKNIVIPELKIHAESFIVYRQRPALSANAHDLLNLLRQWQQKRHPAKRLPYAA